MQTIIIILGDEFDNEVAQGKPKFLKTLKKAVTLLGNQESLQAAFENR